MRSLQITAPGKFRIAEIDPPACAHGEVLLRMKACTICNQHDAAVFAGRAHGGARQYPLEPGFPGHEGAGEVVEVGPGVADPGVGDRVVTTGIGGPPLYSELVTRRADAVVKFPDAVDFPLAAPLEIFGCVHRAFTLTPPVRGVRVGVVGLGPAGQAAVALARAFGAAEVVGFDLDEPRRETARAMGATEVVDAAEFAGAFEAAKAAMAGGPDDAPALRAVRRHQCPTLFECSGSARSMEVSFLLAGRDLTVFGYVPEPVEAIPALWFARELTIRNSKILTLDDLRAVTALLADGSIDTRPIVTEVMPFSQYDSALEKIRRREAIKIALTWD